MTAAPAPHDHSELRACPFCGSDVVLHAYDDGLHWVKCGSCDASGPTSTRYTDDAKADWNTRTSDDALSAATAANAGLVADFDRAVALTRKINDKWFAAMQNLIASHRGELESLRTAVAATQGSEG